MNEISLNILQARKMSFLRGIKCKTVCDRVRNTKITLQLNVECLRERKDKMVWGCEKKKGRKLPGRLGENRMEVMRLKENREQDGKIKRSGMKKIQLAISKGGGMVEG